MAKRYYLSNIIGDGTEDNPFRPAVADYSVPWVGSIPSDPNTGRPLFAWALVLVNTTNHAPLLADTRLDALPDFPLDGKVNAIQNSRRTEMIAAIAKRGVDVGFINNADGYRDVIRGIGQVLDLTFNENNFDVS